MNSVKYIGMDVHKEAICIAVLDSSGKLVMECTIETKASIIVDFLKGLRGSLHVTLEEGTWAAWLYDLIKPHVTELVVCNPRRNALLKEGSKSDRIDARKLAELLRSNMVRSVYHGGEWSTDAAGAGQELPGDQHGCDTSDEPSEGDLSQLGDSLHGQAGLCSAPSFRVAR
jgi:transposase